MAYFLLPEPRPQFFTSVGVPANGYRLFFYLSGTSTKSDTYSDATGLTANTNPVVLASAGWASQGIYLNPEIAYKVVYAPPGSDDPPTSPVWTQDPVQLPVADTPAQLNELQRARTTITGSQNNFDLDALITSDQTEISWLQWNGASACTLTGLQGGADGRWLILENITAAQLLSLAHASGSSSAGNRFLTANALTLVVHPGEIAFVTYDGTESAWRALIWEANAPLAGLSAVARIPGGLVYQSITPVGNITTGEDDLISFTLAANLLSENGQRLTGEFHGTAAANANNKTFKLKYGATTVLSTGALSLNAAEFWWLSFTIIRLTSTTQRCTAVYVTSSATNIKDYYVGNATAAETLSGAVVLKMTGEATSTDDIINSDAHVLWQGVS